MKPKQSKLYSALGLPPEPWAYRAKRGKFWHLSHDGDRMLCGRRIRPARYVPLYAPQHGERIPWPTCPRCAERSAVV
jgi:hypothetical protein